MTNTQNHAIKEFGILELTTPDVIIIPFKKEILALCEAFGKSGQSGGSAPYTASAISRAVNKLLLHEPISDITGDECEWVDVTQIGYDSTMYQNNRCSSLFKNGINSRAHYLDAIVWQGEEEHDSFTGRVYIDSNNFELISSSQYVNFPFKPKTFYIDVIKIPIVKELAESAGLHYIEDKSNECYYYVLKDKKQLEETEL